MFSFNLFGRSGFVNNHQDPHWNMAGGTKPGRAVAMDEARTEVGCLVLNARAADDDNNHTVWFNMDPECFEVGEQVTFSVIVKMVGRDYIYLRENANTLNKSHRSYFNVAGKALGSISSKHTNAFIKDLGNGVCRIGITFTPEDVDNVIQKEIAIGIAAYDASNTFLSEPDTELCILFHAQIEDGSVASKPEVTFPGKGQ